MTFAPVVPWPLVLALGVAAVAVCVGLARRPGRGAAWRRRAGIVVLLVLVALRPGDARADADVVVSDLDVFFVVDRTGSMAAEDHGSGTRLDGATADVLALVDQFPGARWTLVGFDDDVTTLVPLITDRTAFRESVERLRPEVQAQASGSSARLPARTLEGLVAAAREQNPDRRQVVFLLTDGETTVERPSTNSYLAVGKEIAGGAVIGYGTADGGRMRSWDADGPTEDYLVDSRTGEDAVSRIDLATLRAIAGELGVRLVDRTAGDALEPAVDAIDRDGEGTVPGTAPVHEDRGWWWAYPLLGLVWWEVAAVTVDVARAVPRRPTRRTAS